jgi:hypothetical protein
MYACNCKTGRGFFAGVFTPSNATAHSCDPPPPSSKRRLVLHYSKCSGQVFARNTITVAIEVVRIARVLLQHLLCFFMGHETCAVQVAISPTPSTGDYNSGQVLHCDPRLLSVGGGGGFLRWCIAYLPSELFYSEAMALRESVFAEPLLAPPDSLGVSHGQPSELAQCLRCNLGMSGIDRLLVSLLCQVVLA